METKDDVFDRLVSAMSELMEVTHAEFVRVNVSCRDDKEISLRISDLADHTERKETIFE